LRIIAGTVRGRKLFTPGRGAAVSAIRPTADRVREAVFNILGDRVAAAATLDLFAGTGALGLEALSRGCGRAMFVDTSPDAIRLIKKNLEVCGFSDRATVIRRDLLQNPSFLLKIMPAAGFDLIFIDPPYRRTISAKILKYLGGSPLLSEAGIVVVEEAADVALPANIAGLQGFDRRLYGDTAIFFYRHNQEENQHE
jgi:16S rRNA (guanine966-N2)-methyltransferase